jgi:hypothetical protein
MSDKDEYKDLRTEIETKRGDIITNHLNMSVGEFINLYENSEINLEPAFQRLFRWDDYQQSYFIESILLGYPIPAIFVLQRDDGVWDVIDGVQRLSTIYNFVGILKNKEKETCPPLQIQSVKSLKHLSGKYWNKFENGVIKKTSLQKLNDNSFLDTATRMDFKRSYIPVILLKHGSETKSKYELFKRLNSGASRLSGQEFRNALILMNNEAIYTSMENHVNTNEYKSLLNLSDAQLDVRMDLEILCKYIVLKNCNDLDKIADSENIDSFLDDKIGEIIKNPEYTIQSDLKILDKLFEYLKSIADDYNFRIYNPEKDKFTNSFNWFIFETIVWGCTVLNDIEEITSEPEENIKKIKALKNIKNYLLSIESKNSNPQVIKRIKLAKEYAKEVFKNGN